MAEEEYIRVSPAVFSAQAQSLKNRVRRLEQAGIHGAVVGKATAGNDRILRNGEDTRYLDKPQSDELYKIYQ